MPSSRPAILLLTTSSPHPADHGGAQRTELLGRALSEIAEVDTALLKTPNEFTPTQQQTLQQDHGVREYWPLPRRLDRAPWKHLAWLPANASPRLANLIEPRAKLYAPHAPWVQRLEAMLAQRDYAAILCRYLPAFTSPDAGRYKPVVLDIDDFESEVFRSRAQAPGTPPIKRWHLNREAHRLNELITQTAQQAHARFVVREADRQRPGFEDATVLPNVLYTPPGVDAIQPLPLNPSSRELLFVSNLGYAPNRDGVDWLIEHAWPMLREAGWTLRLAGKAHADDAERWASVPGVEVAGFVDSLADAYERAFAVVAPVLTGSGTMLKVLEAAAYGRPVLGPPEAYRGFEDTLVKPSHVAVAREPHDWLAWLNRWADEPSLMQTMAQGGAQAVQAHYSYDRFKQTVHATFTPLLQGQVKPR